MAKALGVLLLGTSLGAAAYGWMLVENPLGSLAPAHIASRAATEAVPAPQPRVISSSRPLAPAPVVVAEAPPAATTAAAQNGANPGVNAVPSPAPVLVPLPRAANEEARRALARDIQSELKRVGCYDGEIDGQWNAPTRKAMGAFNERVNATLPIEAPDFILLTLVQGHAARACGRTCPAGQALSNDNRCLPRALVTKAPAPKHQAPSVAEAPARPKVAAAAQPPAAALPPGRMAIGAPVNGDLVNEKSRVDAEARRKAEQAAIEARRARLEAERKARLETEQKAIVAADAVKSAELATLEERRARLEAERKARIASPAPAGAGPAGGHAPAVLSSSAVAPPAHPAAPKAPAPAAAPTGGDASNNHAAAAAAARIAAARAEAEKAARAQARRYAGAPFAPPMYVTRPAPRPAMMVYPRRSPGAVFNSIARSAP